MSGGRASGTSSCRCATRTRPLPFTEDFTRQVRQALHNLRDKQNVTVRFIGYTDDAPLTGRNERIYGDHLSMSKARALRVALAMQEMLELPTAAIESDGRGASRPLASNEHRAGTDVESPHRGGVLVRRSSAGAAGRAATLSAR